MNRLKPNNVRITPERRLELHRMKASGLDKPLSVSWPDWMGPRRLSHRHLMMAYRCVCGASPKDLAKEFSYTLERIFLITHCSLFLDAMDQIRSELNAKLWPENAESPGQR